MTKLIIILFLLFNSLTSESQEKDTIRARLFADSAWKSYQINYFRKSIRLLDSAISYEPTNSSSYHLKAEAQWFLGNYADAAETYKKMISLSDENLLKVSALVFSGMLYGKAGMTVQEKAQYISAVKLWEGGYVPHKQFRLVEEFDYFLALAFLEERTKAKRIISERKLDGLSLPRRRELEKQNEKCLSLFKKTPKKLLEEYFQEYMLPNDIIPLEE